MPYSTTAEARAFAPTRDRKLSANAAFYLQASITLTFLAGSAAPTPLYPLYQQAWGFSPITTTVVFASYAIAVLGALLVAGRLSDHVGRRPVLIVSALAQAVAMVVLATADGVGGLLVGRIVQGLSTGAAVAAVGAGLLDIDRARGTIVNAIAPIMGTASGALIAGLTVHFLPAPTHLVYALLGVVFVAQAIGVVFIHESITTKPGALASLKPQFAVPPAVRAPMAVAIPMLVAVWAVGGLYGSLSPALLHATFELDSSLFGGLALFVMAAGGAAAVLALHDRDARALMIFGAVSLFAGLAVALGALDVRSAALFFVATAIAGAGFGSGFQGAIRTVMPHAAPHERAGVLSVAFAVSYLAMGVPAVIAGFAVAHGFGLLATAHVFTVVVMALATFALVGTLIRR